MTSASDILLMVADSAAVSRGARFGRGPLCVYRVYTYAPTYVNVEPTVYSAAAGAPKRLARAPSPSFSTFMLANEHQWP